MNDMFGTDFVERLQRSYGWGNHILGWRDFQPLTPGWVLLIPFGEKQTEKYEIHQNPIGIGRGFSPLPPTTPHTGPYGAIPKECRAVAGPDSQPQTYTFIRPTTHLF